MSTLLFKIIAEIVLLAVLVAAIWLSFIAKSDWQVGVSAAIIAIGVNGILMVPFL